MEDPESNTNVMLSIMHIDRGINCAHELEVLFQNLQKNPNELDERTAMRLLRLAQIIKNCFYDCYQNYSQNALSYDEFLKSIDDKKSA